MTFDVTKEAAEAAVRAAAWERGPTDSETEQRIAAAIQHLRSDPAQPEDALHELLALSEGRPRIIHTVGSICGADWGLDGAVDFITKSTKRGWRQHLFGHELAVQSDGRIIRFDVRAPDAVQEAWRAERATQSA